MTFTAVLSIYCPLRIPPKADLYYISGSIGSGSPEVILQLPPEVILPIIVKPASGEQIHLKLYATCDEQTEIPKLSTGLFPDVDHNAVLIEKGDNKAIDLIVKS